MRRRRLLTPALFAATGLLLAGCGSAIPEGAIEAEALACPPGSDCYDPVQPVGPGGELVFEMGEFWFEHVDGVAITGDVEVTVINVGDAFHNIEFIGAAEGSDIPEANPGEEGTGIVKLFPGEVTFFCNVPGHRAAGMEGTITVYATEEDAAAAAEDGEVGAETEPDAVEEEVEPEDAPDDA